VTVPGWGLHNFELAFLRWKRTNEPSEALQELVRNWRSAVEMRGIEAIESWAVISDDDDFVARIPGSPVIATGTLIANEQLVIVKEFDGTDG
jgi:hypothetical protein